MLLSIKPFVAFADMDRTPHGMVEPDLSPDFIGEDRPIEELPQQRLPPNHTQIELVLMLLNEIRLLRLDPAPEKSPILTEFGTLIACGILGLVIAYYTLQEFRTVSLYELYGANKRAKLTPTPFVLFLLTQSRTKWFMRDVNWLNELHNELEDEDFPVTETYRFFEGWFPNNKANFPLPLQNIKEMETDFEVVYEKEENCVLIKSKIRAKERTQILADIGRNKHLYLPMKEEVMQNRGIIRTSNSRDELTECIHNVSTEVIEIAKNSSGPNIDIVNRAIHTTCESKVPYETFIQTMTRPSGSKK